MNKLIMVLGAPNDDNGQLSPIAIDRLYRAFDLATCYSTAKIICTGGKGEHFNNTSKPHYYYAQEFLILKGIPKERFLKGIASTNTVQDFSMSKSFLEKYNPDLLIIITSEFHIERVKLIAEKIIPKIKKFYASVASSLTEEELKPLKEHEKNAVYFLKEHGIQY